MPRTAVAAGTVANVTSVLHKCRAGDAAHLLTHVFDDEGFAVSLLQLLVRMLGQRLQQQLLQWCRHDENEVLPWHAGGWCRRTVALPTTKTASAETLASTPADATSRWSIWQCQHGRGTGLLSRMTWQPARWNGTTCTIQTVHTATIAITSSLLLR